MPSLLPYHRSVGPLRALLLCALGLAIISAPLYAQGVRVQVAKQPGPYYIGQPVVIQFTAEGFDEQPVPTVAMAPTPGLRGQVAAANPSLFSQMISRNGRVSRSTRISYRIHYVVTADQPGDYNVGPFVIKQGKLEARIAAVPMSFATVPKDPDMRVRLILPKGNVYPDQRVPVRVEWWYAGKPRDIQRLSIYSPLFDEFRFAPDPKPLRNASRLPLDTKQGRLLLPADARNEQHQGRSFIVIQATRTLIADRVGRFELTPITATLEKTTAWAQQQAPLDNPDFGFGSALLRDMLANQRRPARTALSRAVGVPQTLVVKPFPRAGRPESFAGAVGNGFSIDVAADRTVVHVGDPIRLHITLRGEGNLENASLAPLSADNGMDPNLFRLPAGDLPGVLTDGIKQFDMSVRVLEQSVTEIPAVAYSWFNPTTEAYQTARSKPIALRVMPAQIISAADVIHREKAPRKQAATNTASPDAASANDPSQPTEPTASQPRGFSLSGADLAIELAPAVVLHNADRATSQWWLQTALYAAGFFLVAIALIDRRRKNVDPALVAMRKVVRRQQARIERAMRLPRSAAAQEVADALRALVAQLPDTARDEAQDVIAACESIVFAPDQPNTSHLDDALVERAKATAAVFERAAASMLKPHAPLPRKQ